MLATRVRIVPRRTNHRWRAGDQGKGRSVFLALQEGYLHDQGICLWNALKNGLDRVMIYHDENIRMLRIGITPSRV
jgi:hypothetical protein